MSDLPTPKYRIGQRVYRADMAREVRHWPCPDCLGTKKWKLTTPAGGEAEVSCRRCGNVRISTGGHRDLPSVDYEFYVGIAVPFVVERVEAQSSPHFTGDDVVKYWSGHGGMSERDLYDDEKIALVVARLRAAARNEEAAREPRAMEARELAGLDFHLAAGRVEWSNYYDSWRLARHYREAIESLLEDKTLGIGKDARDYLVGDVLADADRTPGWLPNHPIDRLIRAALAKDTEAASAIAAEITEKHGPLPPAPQEETEI